MLWVVLELNNVEMAVGAAHQVRLRAAAHAPDVLCDRNRHAVDATDSEVKEQFSLSILIC